MAVEFWQTLPSRMDPVIFSIGSFRLQWYGLMYLVAFADGELAGTIVLRDRAIQSLPEPHPGLGGLFVPSKHRTRGIGTELVRVGMDVAREQGYEVVYATTAVAGGILERLGWAAVREVSYNDEQLTLYRCRLEMRNPT